MSELNESKQESQILYTPKGINARRDVLYKHLAVNNIYQESLNPYYFSEERKEDLEKDKQLYKALLTSLEKENESLVKKINEEPINLNNLKEYEDNITSLLNTNPFLVPNSKIQKIIGWVSTDSVNGLKLELSDSGTREYGRMDGSKIEYPLKQTEFLIKIDKIDSSTAGTLGNALIFYTSSGRKHIVKGDNVDIDPDKFSEEKIFAINPTYQRWEWHEAEAKKYGYTLASIADSGEANKVSNLMRQRGYGSVWAGGRRTRRGRSRGADSWKWVDGSPWNYTTAWGGGEPNDCCGGEDYLQVNSHGRWNDLFPYNLPGIYSKKIKRYTINSVTSGGSDMEIIGLNSIDNLNVETDKQYINDTEAIDNLQSLKDNINSLKTDLENATDDAKIEHSRNLKLMKLIKNLVYTIDKEIDTINKANKSVPQIDKFTNMGDKVNEFLKNIFTNNKSMTEGFKEGQESLSDNKDNLNSQFYDYIMRLFNQTRRSINDELEVTDNFEYEENRNYMLELLAQKNQVASNILMDYMINDTEGSNAEQLYETMNQENQDKKRKIQINNYYSKTYVEYSHILKVIILLIAIMIPFLILTKYEILDKNISLTVVVILSFLGFLYVLYRLYLLYMKDNINFDKYRIPYDREASKNLLDRKKIKPGFRGFGITCIGEECCSEGMEYDPLKHQCFPVSQPEDVKEEGFTNFEGFNGKCIKNEATHNYLKSQTPPIE